MKILLLLIVSVVSSATLFAQQSQQLPSEVIVRLNYTLLDWATIDDGSIVTGNISDFLSDEGNDIAARIKENGFPIGNLGATKLFPHLNTGDSISISRLGKRVHMPPFWATFKIKVSSDMKFWDLFHELKKHYPIIIYVDPPMVIEWLDVPNDSLLEYQLSIYDTVVPQDINVVDAWDIETGENFIRVGVFDTGIDGSHEDLDVLTGYGYNHQSAYVDSTGAVVYAWGEDNQGHGTNVAGIIAAKRNNGIGIAGIAGGNGDSTSGVQLIDMALGSLFDDGNLVAMALIDASRSVGTYHDWNSGGNVSTPAGNPYWNNARGYGIQVGNHSYTLRTHAAPPIVGKGLPNSDSSGWSPIPIIPFCNLCREAHLFSLQNGVTNVVARGNNSNPDSLQWPGGDKLFPQNFDDTWIVTVGASGTDGNRLHAPDNTDAGEWWWSPIGKNIDVIAPGSRASVATTRSSNLSDTLGLYRNFNGTSASAPHVTGVVALLLSHYNKPCYSNINLDPADIEYILEHSATDVNPNVAGYDDSTGYGRLDAHKALQMIDLPEYQIVHPPEMFTDTSVVSRDTITCFVDQPINSSYAGPLGGTFPINATVELNSYYEMERIQYEVSYDFSAYRLPSNQLLDIWFRASETNSLRFIEDTSSFTMGSSKKKPIVWIQNYSIVLCI